MRKLFGLVVLLVALAGCSVNQQFVKSVKANWEPIKTDFVKYVDADPALTDQDKSIRRDSVAAMDLLIKEAEDE